MDRKEVIRMTEAVEGTKRCVQAVLDRIAAVLEDGDIQDAERLDIIATIVQESKKIVSPA